MKIMLQQKTVIKLCLIVLVSCFNIIPEKVNIYIDKGLI